MGTLNPKAFESGEFRRVNDFLSNPDIFPDLVNNNNNNNTNKSLPRESIGSATIRWPCGCTGRCAGSMG